MSKIRHIKRDRGNGILETQVWVDGEFNGYMYTRGGAPVVLNPEVLDACGALLEGYEDILARKMVNESMGSEENAEVEE